MAKVEELLESISQLTVLELSELVKAAEEKFGVTAAAPMAFAGMPMMGGGAAAAEEEAPTSFDVVLVEAGAEKIKVIKEVRTITGLGLKEAKDLVDGAPKTVKEGCDDAEAKQIKETLEGAGAKVELKPA